MGTSSPSPQLQTMKAEFFRALAHPIRIRLLEVLVATDECSVQDLQRTLGIDQPIVSQQLARLRSSGIVATRNTGAATRYSVADPLIGDRGYGFRHVRPPPGRSATMPGQRWSWPTP